MEEAFKRYETYIGKRIIIEGSDKTWANGLKGTIEALIECEESPFEHNTHFRVLIDDMDRSKPPFGLVILDRHEFIFDEEKAPESDPVNHPSHYTDGKYEVIDYIESKGYFSNFYLANAVKYISRAGKKDPEKKNEDLKKAVWYLERWLPVYRSKLSKKTIETKDYIIDKGLEGTPGGIALELIDKNEYELAIKALKLEAEKE